MKEAIQNLKNKVRGEEVEPWQVGGSREWAQRAMAYPCPDCGAEAGYPCRDEDGNLLDKPHSNRKTAFKD